MEAGRRKVNLKLEKSDRSVKVGISASSVDEVIRKAKDVFGLSENLDNCKLVLSSDIGTQIVDDDYLVSLEPDTQVMVLTPAELRHLLKPVDEQDSAQVNNTTWKSVLRKIKPNVALIALLSEAELEAIADEDDLEQLIQHDPEIRTWWSENDVIQIVEHFQKVLDSKRKLSEAVELAQLCKRASQESANETQGEPLAAPSSTAHVK